ncbi:MAG: phage holin family protein [Burkholderiaceae bacterium]|jgi:putative membrane protein|nr:phage holin family protein [Burkholderiaceae bacterium]
MRILLVWILNAIALWLVTLVVPGVQVQDELSAFIAAVVLGLVNALVKPVLIILTLPITVLTLGLFLLVLNALLFWGVGELLPGFNVDGFWWAMLGALIYSLLTWAMSSLLPKNR